MSRVTALCSITLLLWGFGALSVYAAGSNYSVSPLILDYDLEKRSIEKETITITNMDNRVIRIYPTVNEVSVQEGGAVEGFVTPAMTDRTNTPTSWIEITRARIELQPGESKEIPLTIRVNPNVQSGEYHVFIGFPEASNKPEAQKKVQEGRSPGTAVRISVDEVQSQFLRLERFVVDRFITGPKESTVQYTLHNPGEDPVTPAGEIIFYDNRGNEKGAIPVNSDGRTIEPGKSSEFLTTVPEELSIGKYKAFLSAEFGEHLTASVHDTAFFYVMPLSKLLMIFGAILFVAILLALYVHRKFDMAPDDDGTDAVPMFLRSERSQPLDHDIDLKSKKE